MRKTLIPIALATLLVATLGAPGVANPTNKTDIVPLDYDFESWNPCTGQAELTHFTGELRILALPSIEAFDADEATHITLKWVGRFVAEDGYSTTWKNYARQVVNVRDVEPTHVVINEVDNIVFSSNDGGKYKTTFRFHVTDVGGELKAFTNSFDARCIRRPRS